MNNFFRALYLLESKNPQVTGIIYAIISEYCINIANFISRSLSKDYSKYQIIHIVGLILVISNWLLSKSQSISLSISPRYVIRLVWIRLVCVFVGSCLYFEALPLLPYSEATVINNLRPIVTSFIAVLFLGEQYTLRLFLTTVVSILGVILVAKPSFLFEYSSEDQFFDRKYAIILMVGACILFSTGVIIFKKVSNQVHPNAIAFYLGAALAAGNGAACVFSFTKLMDPTEYLLAIGDGLFESLGQITYGRALMYSDITYVSLAGYMRIVFGHLNEYIFERRVPDKYSLIGSILVFCSILINIIFLYKKK